MKEFKAKPVTFTIIPPQNVEANHTLYGGKLGCPAPIFDDEGNLIGWYSNDIDNSVIRLSAYLEVILLPIDVNFQAVPVIENPHHDSPGEGVITYPGYFLTLCLTHEPNPNPEYPDEKNVFTESIGMTIPTPDIQEEAKRMVSSKIFLCLFISCKKYKRIQNWKQKYSSNLYHISL